MIEIVNIKNAIRTFDYDVFIDRRTIVGNPFPMKNESERTVVCDRYEKYFSNKMINDYGFRNFVNKLIEVYKKFGKLRLFCWCSPKRCHGETIKNYIEDSYCDHIFKNENNEPFDFCLKCNKKLYKMENPEKYL